MKWPTNTKSLNWRYRSMLYAFLCSFRSAPSPSWVKLWRSRMPFCDCFRPFWARTLFFVRWSCRSLLTLVHRATLPCSNLKHGIDSKMNIRIWPMRLLSNFRKRSNETGIHWTSYLFNVICSYLQESVGHLFCFIRQLNKYVRDCLPSWKPDWIRDIVDPIKCSLEYSGCSLGDAKGQVLVFEDSNAFWV